MASVIKLDLDPDDSLDFERAVDIPTPSGKPLKVTFSFKYRDRLGVAEFFDAYLARSRDQAQAAAQSGDALSMQHVARASVDADVATLLDAATGWNIDAEWCEANLRKLCTKYAGACSAIVTDYRISLTQGRVGN